MNPSPWSTFSTNPTAILEAVLTIALRPLIDGIVPAIVIVGNGPRSGKTMLANWLSGGHAVYGVPRSENAWQKTLETFALTGEPLAVFDDVVSGDSPSLMRFITASKHIVRPLWKREFVELPNRSVLILAGNFGEIVADLFRRSIVIRLEHRDDFPADYKLPAFDDVVATLLGRWRRAGFPLAAEPVKHGFEGWSRLVFGIVNAKVKAPLVTAD